MNSVVPVDSSVTVEVSVRGVAVSFRFQRCSEICNASFQHIRRVAARSIVLHVQHQYAADLRRVAAAWHCRRVAACLQHSFVHSMSTLCELQVRLFVVLQQSFISIFNELLFVSSDELHCLASRRAPSFLLLHCKSVASIFIRIPAEYHNFFLFPDIPYAPINSLQ
ncbi:unnamed protein product [Victoria cruziana]